MTEVFSLKLILGFKAYAFNWGLGDLLYFCIIF